MVDKQDIIRFLQKRAQRPVRLKEIARGLEVGTQEYGGLKRLIRKMEEAGEIYRVRRRRYALPERINLAVGRLQVTRGGHGFVLQEAGEADVFVPASRLGNAFDGDRVVARVERRRKGQNPEGSVVKVLERARSQVVGVYRRSGRYGYLIPRAEGMRRDVFIPSGGGVPARDGELAVARIVDWGSDHHDPVGEIVKVLGQPGAPGVDVLAIAFSHELPFDFPAEVESEAERLTGWTIDPAELARRTDLREKLIFTIDPEDAKDHDDAISIEPLGPDRWQIGVHIADVSHFVTERSEIDLEAFRRGTSVYLVDRVLPMLPEVLSGNICSLKAGEDRLALSVQLQMNALGKVLSLELAGTVIRSRAALSYQQAQAIIDGKETAEAGLATALRQLRDLADRLRKARQQRGGLDFDLPESRVIVNAAGEPTDVQQLMRLETHRLIEEFMILVNESVARLAMRRALPFIFRIHEPPDPDRLERLREFVAGLGFSLPKNAHVAPRALQKLLSAVEDQPAEAVISTLVLRSMKQARYSAELAGHFGLGSGGYTHFTSPIRRYPDLVIHRIIRAAILEGAPIRDSLREELASVAQQASLRERQAMEAERESVDLKRMEYMERHLGDIFDGTINGVTSYGLFVLLDGVLAEGLIHVSRLEDDYYHYREEDHSLVGEVRRRRFRLGDRVAVQVLRVDREARKLDLALVEGTAGMPN